MGAKPVSTTGYRLGGSTKRGQTSGHQTSRLLDEFQPLRKKQKTNEEESEEDDIMAGYLGGADTGSKRMAQGKQSLLDFL